MNEPQKDRTAEMLEELVSIQKQQLEKQEESLELLKVHLERARKLQDRNEQAMTRAENMQRATKKTLFILFVFFTVLISVLSFVDSL